MSRSQKTMAFDQYGQEQQGQEDFVMQWVQSQLPIEMILLCMTSARCMKVIGYTYLVQHTCLMYSTLESISSCCLPLTQKIPPLNTS